MIVNKLEHPSCAKFGHMKCELNGWRGIFSNQSFGVESLLATARSTHIEIDFPYQKAAKESLHILGVQEVLSIFYSNCWHS